MVTSDLLFGKKKKPVALFFFKFMIQRFFSPVLVSNYKNELSDGRRELPFHQNETTGACLEIIDRLHYFQIRKMKQRFALFTIKFPK